MTATQVVVVRCDGCQQEVQSRTASVKEARAELAVRGWELYRRSGDLCPQCFAQRLRLL